MASVLKLPIHSAKGLLVFTTIERDLYIRPSPSLRIQIQELKEKWLIGLHHNSAHADNQFVPDPVFDFHIAGPGDLHDPQGRAYYQIEMDCSNFCPDFFSDQRPAREKFWDVLFISRNVEFKGLDDLLVIARKLFDRKRHRILAIVAHQNLHLKGVGPSQFMKKYMELFNDEERKCFTLLTPSLDAPFPFDLETLAHFYRNSKLFLHVAKAERHPRVVAYAWASDLPVVAPLQVGSLLPNHLKCAPGFYPYETIKQAVDGICDALNSTAVAVNRREYSNHHLISRSVPRFKKEIQELFAHYDLDYLDEGWLLDNLDIRLARHHTGEFSRNTVNQSVSGLVLKLKTVDQELLINHDSTDFEFYFSDLKVNFDKKMSAKIDYNLKIHSYYEYGRQFLPVLVNKAKKASRLFK